MAFRKPPPRFTPFLRNRVIRPSPNELLQLGDEAYPRVQEYLDNGVGFASAEERTQFLTDVRNVVQSAFGTYLPETRQKFNELFRSFQIPEVEVAPSVVSITPEEAEAQRVRVRWEENARTAANNTLALQAFTTSLLQLHALSRDEANRQRFEELRAHTQAAEAHFREMAAYDPGVWKVLQYLGETGQQMNPSQIPFVMGQIYPHVMPPQPLQTLEKPQDVPGSVSSVMETDRTVTPAQDMEADAGLPSEPSDLPPEDVVPIPLQAPVGQHTYSDAIHPGLARRRIYEDMRESLIQSDVYRPCNRWRDSD